MKRRLLLRLVVLASAGLFVTFLYAWCNSPSCRINCAAFERIQEGMTEPEVEAVIGYPPGIYGSDTMIVSHHGKTVAESEAQILSVNRPFRLTGFDDRIWASSRGFIYVRFKHGLVLDKLFCEVDFSLRGIVAGWFAVFR